MHPQVIKIIARRRRRGCPWWWRRWWGRPGWHRRGRGWIILIIRLRVVVPHHVLRIERLTVIVGIC